MDRNNNRVGKLGTAIAAGLMALLIAATGVLIWLCLDMVNTPAQTEQPQQTVTVPAQTTAATVPTTAATEPPTTAPPVEPEKVVATATIASQGDLLMHEPVFRTCRQEDGSYNFDSIFQYMTEYVSSYDYALANLETTFGGDNYKYQGNPAFNCPDELADSVVLAGYDMLLTANNHCGDTMADGVQRTVEHARNKGLATLGTQLEGEKRYSVVEINGIKIGMVCYSWAYSYDGAKVSMNGLTPIKDTGTINFFRNNNLDAFYKELEQILAAMKEEGAEATMMQIHWGVEYDTTENATQNKIAQKLCDLGFDVIVGGHPHVVQPMELLTSTVDESHKTVCIYSLGNAVSNQRNGYISAAPAYYTEDGVLFEVTFEKYSDGTVYVAGCDVLPTWVNMRTDISPKEYNIVPLDMERREEWSNFGLTDNSVGFAEKSYDRTMKIVGEGLEQCQSYLAAQKEAREQYYYDLAYNPEKFAEPAATQIVTVPQTIVAEAA